MGNSDLVRFGSFELDPASGELRKNGARVRLQEQPFQVLRALVERPGEVVTREELHERLWPGDTFVEFDDGLNTAVRKIRQALGDSADNPRFVETLPRRGYRFIAPLDRPRDLSGHPGGPPRDVTQRARKSESSRRRFGWFAAAAAAVLAVLLWWGYFAPSDATAPSGPMTMAPLTSYPGTERYPSFSPDGERGAFAWDGESRDNFDIYIQNVGSHGPPVRLTTHAAHDLSPTWSPDGDFIAFARTSDPFALLPAGVAIQCEIFVVPAIGGPLRKVAESSFPRIAWLSDGESFLGSLRPAPDEPPALFVFLANGEKKQVSRPPAGSRGDFLRAVSPNRRSAVFFRSLGINVSVLLSVDVQTDFTPQRPPTEWTSTIAPFPQATWSPDGRELIVVQPLMGQLARLSRPGGDPVALPLTAPNVIDPDVSAKTNRLVFSRQTWEANLGVLRRKSAEVGFGQTEPFPSSTLWESAPHYSPDGKRVAFTSARTGLQSVWVSEADGSGATLLHSFGSNMAGSPRWSPDGRRIAFDSPIEGTFDIYAGNVSGGKPLRLTGGPAFDHMPRWSADGRWLYFTSKRSERSEIWKVSAAGGVPQKVTRNGGTLALPSPDGAFLYYLKDENLPFNQHSQLWRMPIEGGEEQLIIERVFSRNFAVTEKGIYFMRGPEAGSAREGFAVRYLDLAGGEIRTLTTLRPETKPFYGFTVSPDELTILYTYRDTIGADLMLVENFR